MSEVRCFSSQMLTKCLEWQHLSKDHKVASMRETSACIRGVKWTIGTLGANLSMLTSIVETVVYSILTLLSVVFIPVSNKPYKFMAGYLNSSTFTILWSMSNRTAFTYGSRSVPEVLARINLSHTTCCCIPMNFERPTDYI